MKRRPRSSALTGTLIAWFLAACGPAAPSPSAPASALEPTGSTSASDPAAEASGNPPPTIGETPDGAILHVVADELRMRAEAGTASTLVGTLERGDVVRVESGPLDADGFRWFEVVDLQGRRGWAADGDGTDPWLALIPDPPEATPILTLEYVCDVSGPVNAPATTVTDDGRVIATDQAAGYGWIVRPLSSEGMAQLREGVLESPYLQASGEYRPRPRADAGDPPGHGVCSYTFTISTDANPIVVTTIGWFGDEEERMFYEPSPERKALDGVARNLIAIDDVLGDEAWEATALPYVAGAYSFHIGPGIGPAPQDARSIDPESLGIGDIGSFGAPAGSGRCDTISRPRAFEVARILLEASPGATVRLDAVSFPYFTTDEGWFNAVLAPVLPNGQPDCASIRL